MQSIWRRIVKNKKDKALLEFQKLTDKKHPLEILAAIQTMLRKWIILKTKSSTCSPAELSRLTGQHEFVVKQSLVKLKNTSAADLVKLRQNLAEAEYKIKSGQTTDGETILELAMLS